MYKMKGIWAEMWGTLTNTVPVDAYRSAGRPKANYLLEHVVDIAVRWQNMDLVEIRRKNFIPIEEFPYQTPVAFQYDSGNHHVLFDRADLHFSYQAMRQQQEQDRAQGKAVGIGVPGSIEASGLAPSQVEGSLGSAIGFWESGHIRVHASGKVSVSTGAHSHGQGQETTFAQVIADEFGVDIHDIEIVHGDTAHTVRRGHLWQPQRICRW